MKQPAAFWPGTHHTGTKAPSSSPAGHHLAVYDESAAVPVSASQPGDLGEEDTPRADYLGHDLAKTVEDSAPPDDDWQIQFNQGQESEVLSQSQADKEPKTPGVLPRDHVSQENAEDTVSKATDNSHTPNADSPAAAQRRLFIPVTKALWALFSLMALSTAFSMAALWTMRMRRVTRKQQAVRHKVSCGCCLILNNPPDPCATEYIQELMCTLVFQEALAPLCMPLPATTLDNPLFAGQDKSLNHTSTDNSSDKENEPEHPHRSNSAILAVKGLTNANFGEVEDLRRQVGLHPIST